MAVNLSPVFGVAGQLFDNNGNPLAGGKIFTYLAGTTTNATTYTSSNGSIAHSNPIILDGAGRVPSGEIWLTDGINYKFVVQDAANNLIGTYDNLTGINSNFVAFTNQQEIQTATAGQTVFNLTTMQYQPGTNSLSVFVDGVNQYGPGAQYAYVETDQDTVTFVSGLHVGASVKFTTSQLNTSGAVDASQVSYDPPFVGSVATNVEDKLAQTVSVKDFGAVGDGVADDTAAIQAALDESKGVYFPQGTYKITSALNMSSDSYVFGCGRSSVIQSTHNGAIFQGKNVTPASGTNVRVYRGGGTDLYLIGPGSGLGASIGLDMRGCSQFKWYNIGIQDVNSGVVQGDGYSTYYNEYYATDIANVVFGYYNTQLANENTVFGGRVLNSTIGTQDSDNSHNKYIGVAVEGWITAGHKVAAPTAQYISFISSRLENAGGTGIVIDATAQATYILAPAFQSLSTNINNAGDGTTVVSDVNWTINSGTTITKHQSITATLDFSSISANTSQDIFVANTGSTVNDSVFVTPNPSVASNLMFMAIPATGGVYVRCANVSTGAIDPASQSFRIDIWQHA